MNETASNNTSQSENDIVSVVNGFIWLFATAGVVIYLPILYKKIRCKFPVSVNCWFCNKNSRVPYEDANCWDCAHCEQYNGFNKDGGYNKEIKEQYSSNLNPLVYGKSLKYPNNNGLAREKTASNGLCKLCNVNQQLKIQQLARFVPLNEENYDQEVEQFRQQLEKSYHLCSHCERTLTVTLQNQQYNLLKNRLNFQKEEKLSNLNGISGSFEYQYITHVVRKVLHSGLKLISGLISFLMLLSFTSQLETELQFLKSTLPDVFMLDYQPILKEFLYYLTCSHNMRKELISIGLLCYALSSFCRQVRCDHPSLLLFWGILYAMSWSDMTALQVLVSAVCLLLSVLEIEKSSTYTLKKLAVRGNEPERNARIMDQTAAPSLSGDESTWRRREKKENLNETEELSHFFNETKIVESVQEIPLSESPELKSKTPPKSQISEPQTSQIRSNKIFSKTFLATLENEKIEKEMSPAPEIFHNLKNLHIGNNLGPSEKPSNFLFENHNFEERCKRTSPILKAPKFVKPSNSWANGELNETISRSSTPSSGYSSQKVDKPESRQNFLFPKVISPISFGRSTSPDNFDCWDRSHPCFNSNNCHYFAPSCMPFPGNPLGHTTVYTYTRPANYPFAFTPSPTSSSYCFPSGQRTPPRFSDVSETENLFQGASASFQWSQRWSSMKSALYYVSLFFNIISTIILAYFTWSGIISLTGN